MPVPQSLREEDYEAIEAAVMDTARGRWFLSEYARRNRTANTAQVLEAIAGLEQKLGKPQTVPDDGLKNQLREIIEAIAGLQKNLAPTGADKRKEAAQQILASAEEVQEAAWSLRELGAHPDFCQRLDRSAADIQAACSLQEISGHQNSKILQTLAQLEECLRDFAGPADIPARAPETATASDEELGQDNFDIIEPETAPAPHAPTLIRAQSTILPRSSLPQLQAKLAGEWPDESEMVAANSGHLLDLADHSFEEKLALFS
jgi:hypothetical protein